MNFRKAEMRDLEAVAVLFDNYRVFYRKTSNIDEARSFLKNRIDQNDSTILIAENSDDKLVGFAQLYPLFSSTRMKKLWLLNDLFVSCQYRGKGISKELLQQAKQLVMETNAYGMILETEKSNDIGNNLYPKTGFQLNTVSNYYEWCPE